MKLKTYQLNHDDNYVDTCEAVTYVCEREARRHEGGELERVKARHDALENIVGQLLGAMIANGQLRAEQVYAILNYDVTVEAD